MDSRDSADASSYRSRKPLCRSRANSVRQVEPVFDDKGDWTKPLRGTRLRQQGVIERIADIASQS